MFWVSVLLPALMLTLVYLASAEQPKSESTAQDVVNCSNVDVFSLLESVRSIEIGIASEEDDSSEEEEEEAVSDSIKRILRDLVHALEAVESQTIDLSPPKAVPLDEYSMICQNEAPSPSVLNNATNDSTSSHDIREQLNLLASQSKDLIEPVVPWLHCVLPTAEELEIEQMQDIEEMLNVYVDPAVYAVIFVLGLVWNGVLILIFVRQKQLWTPPNVMVFNLALADLISLVWNVAFFCFEIYTKQDIDNDEDFCVYHVIGRPMSSALVALSEGALSILRYVGILHNPKKLKQTRGRFFLYILILWLLALALAFPYTYMVKYTPGNCNKYGNKELTKILITSEFVVYFGLLPAVMIVFNTLTARRLKRSVRELSSTLTKNGQGAVRHRNANMLMVFMAIFLLTCVPHYVLRLIRFWDVPCNWKLLHLWMYKVSYYPLFANHCLNPISLYLMSGTFRAHYKHYFSFFFRQFRNKGTTAQ